MGRAVDPFMNDALARLIRDRARNACEYCKMPEAAEELTFEVDHIIARKHRGPTVASNLCLSCWHCNLHKGSDISSIDPQTGRLSALSHPRRQRWAKHFRWQGAVLDGMTARGRVTILLLRINDPFRISLRESLLAEGAFPVAPG